MSPEERKAEMSYEFFFEALSPAAAASTAMTVLVSSLFAMVLFTTRTAASAPPLSPQNLEREIGFTEQEIHRYEGILFSVASRAEIERDSKKLAKLKKELLELDSRLSDTRKVLADLRAHSSDGESAFFREDVRSTLNALQESGTHAIEAVLRADTSGAASYAVPAAYRTTGFATSSGSISLGSDQIP